MREITIIMILTYFNNRWEYDWQDKAESEVTPPIKVKTDSYRDPKMEKSNTQPVFSYFLEDGIDYYIYVTVLQCLRCCSCIIIVAD